jgi:hypothetical protein
MPGVFYISGLNGFRWTLETFTPDPKLNNLPADLEIDDQNYAVPIQKGTGNGDGDSDFPALVLLSDFPDMTLEFRKCTGELIGNPVLGATSSSIVGQTFLQYLATVDFTAFPIGRCYGRVSYDANLPAQIAAKVTQLLSPAVDGQLNVLVNGVSVADLIHNGDSYSGQALAGLSYEFTAVSTAASSAANPRIRMTVTKVSGGISQVIYDKSEVQNGANSFSYSGIAQPGAQYSAVVVTEDTAVVVAPINIADTAPVVPNIQSWISCPIDVQPTHADTQLIQYQNSENTESVLFHPSELILQTRIAANFIGGYQAKDARETFEDQPYNPVLLNGFNYDIYTHYLTGYEIQLPDWRIKQLNLIWNKCDQVKIDYDFYVAVGDFKGERPTSTYNRNGYNYERDLQIVKGFEFGQLTAGITPTGDLIVVRKTWPATTPFPLFSNSFAINGVFTQYSTIDYFETINPDLSTFILKIGTTVGGNDIYEGEVGTPNADASVELIETHRPLIGFNAATTVYVTIPGGISIQFIIVYDQLDSPPIVAPTGMGSSLPQGTIAYYKELVAGYFTRDWDIATGLGQVGSQYEGCQIYDEAAGKVLVAWDRSTIDPDKGRGTPGVTGALEVGNVGNTVTIARANLPAEGLNIFTTEINSTDADVPGVNDTVARASNESISRKDYEIHRGTIEPTSGRTALMGAGTAISVANDGLIMLCYIKL